MKKYHQISNIAFDNEKMYLLIDGSNFVFELKQISQKLAKASPIEREKYKISPSGYGIHWYLIDEDLSIDGLVGVIHTQSLKKKQLPIRL